MILHIIQEPPLLSRASDLAAALSCSDGMRQEQKHGDQYQLVKLLLSSHSWESLELRNKTYIYNIYFSFYDGFKKLSERIHLLKGCLGHELSFDPHVTGRCTVRFSMDFSSWGFWMAPGSGCHTKYSLGIQICVLSTGRFSFDFTSSA